MKVLIVYATRHGSSEKAAKILKTKISGKVILQNLKKKKNPLLNEYDVIIVGGSIHAGEIQQKVKQFLAKNHEILTKKHLGLFLCCMDKKLAQEQFERAFPEELRKKSIANEIFGGEFDFDKMNWFERLAVKKIAGVDKSVSEIDEEAILRFAKKINQLLL